MRTHPLETVRARVSDVRAVIAIRAFSTYQAGNLVMTVGFWMQRIAVGWVTWELTGSEAWLGAVAFAELFPSILTAILGGALADRHPTPRVMFWGQIASAGVAAGLATLYWSGGLTPPAMVAMMALLGAVSGALLPARLAMASYLVPPALLPSALGVNSTVFNLSRFLGPALAAGLLVVANAGVVFAFATAGFLGFAVALHGLRRVLRQGERHTAQAAVSTGRVMRDLVATPTVFGVILLQCALGILVRPASELFPAYAEVAFGMGAAGPGALNAALGIGAILGALALSKARRTRAALIQILTMSAVFALSLLAFALSTVFWAALLVLVVYGIAMASANIAALAYVQLQTPPDRLGRVLSVYTIVFRVGPAIGAFLFGLAAEATSLLVTGLAFGVAGLAATGALALYILRRAEPAAPGG